MAVEAMEYLMADQGKDLVLQVAKPPWLLDVA